MRNLKTQDIAWLAGLLEGEGSFGMGSQNKTTPTLRLQMCDQDVVKRAASLMEASLLKPTIPRKEHWKSYYTASLCSTPAIEWMMTIYSLMGLRRQQRIREVIAAWKIRNTRGPMGQNRKALCHPDRPLWEIKTGFCKNCYHRVYVKRTGKNGAFYRRRKKQLNQEREVKNYV